ncbi:uncharacterized protein LOC135395250 [Ornithodoros turicata]|uniref:uncharacterized protein LOC135395250 n=1 Tax=Ornithodoros turicata TaxID=34597 RepID=UPI00313A38A5
MKDAKKDGHKNQPNSVSPQKGLAGTNEKNKPSKTTAYRGTKDHRGHLPSTKSSKVTSPATSGQAGNEPCHNPHPVTKAKDHKHGGVQSSSTKSPGTTTPAHNGKPREHHRSPLPTNAANDPMLQVKPPSSPTRLTSQESKGPHGPAISPGHHAVGSNSQDLKSNAAVEKPRGHTRFISNDEERPPKLKTDTERVPVVPEIDEQKPKTSVPISANQEKGVDENENRKTPGKRIFGMITSFKRPEGAGFRTFRAKEENEHRYEDIDQAIERLEPKHGTKMFAEDVEVEMELSPNANVTKRSKRSKKRHDDGALSPGATSLDGTSRVTPVTSPTGFSSPRSGTTSAATKKSKRPQRQFTVTGAFVKLWKRMTYFGHKGDGVSQVEEFTPGEVASFVGVFLILIVILLLLYYYYQKRTSKLERLQLDCTSSECQKIRKSLTSMLNVDADPCTDYYSYVCDNWLQNHSNVSFIEHTVQLYHRNINATLFGSKPEPTDKQGMHLFSRLYRTCYEYLVDSDLTLETIVSITSQELGISQVLKASTFAEILTYLVNASVTRGFSSLFSLNFIYKDKKPYLYLQSTASIQDRIEETIRGAVPQERNYSFSSQFEGYVRDVVKAIYHENDAERHVGQVVKWDRAFDILLKKPSTEVYKSLDALSDVFAPISMNQVVDLVNRMTPPRLALNAAKDLILVRGFQAIVDMIATISNETLLSRGIYFAVHLITNVLRFFYLQQHLINASPDVLVTTCLRITQKALLHTWPYLISRKLNYADRASAALMLAQSIKLAVKQGEASKWMTADSTDFITSELDTLNIVTYHSSMLDHMQSTYDQLPVGDNVFLVTYFAIKRFETKVLLNWLPTDADSVIAEHQVMSNLQGVRFKDKLWLFISTAYQSAPLFQFNAQANVLPFYMNHPTVGVLVAKELVRSITLSRNWDHKTSQAVQKYMDCLASIQSSLGIQPEDQVTWQKEAFAWSYGSRLSYRAMREIFHDYSKLDSSLFHAAQELFFILSCLISCSPRDSGPAFLSKEQCIIPLLSNVDFLQYYKCTNITRLTCISSLYSS